MLLRTGIASCWHILHDKNTVFASRSDATQLWETLLLHPAAVQSPLSDWPIRADAATAILQNQIFQCWKSGGQLLGMDFRSMYGG